MKTKSKSENTGVGGQISADQPFKVWWRVGDFRNELGRRVRKASAISAPTIADRLRLAYYQNVLRFYEPLPSETRVHSGFAMLQHSSDHQREVREINQILDYLLPDSERKPAEGVPPHGSIALALPGSARPAKEGRPVARRLVAVRALQMKIDTGESWLAITLRVCDCTKKEHDQSCKEAIRQSVMTLKRFLKSIGIELPEDLNLGV